MAEEGYDVLRMIEHSQSCYISSEYVQGEPLIRWLKYHPNLLKEQLFSLIQKMTVRLGQFHRCRGNPCYQYVNPYSLILTKEGELYFLDLKSEANKKELRKMQRRSVRENFLAPDTVYYQQSSVEQDIYGLGKTMQYLLAAAESEPPLTKREELKFQKIISKCLERQSKKAYQNIPDILQHLPVCKTSTKEKPKRKKGRLVKAGSLILLLLLAGAVIQGKILRHAQDGHQEPEKLQERSAVPEEQVQKKAGRGTDSEVDRLQFEMGMLHLLDTGEYAEARRCFQEAGGELAESYGVIAEYFQEGDAQQDKGRLRQALELAQKSMAKEVLTDKGRADCIRSLVKGYSMLGTREDAGEVIRLGKAYLQMEEKVQQKEEARKENSEYMAAAYEKTEETQEARSLYETLLGQEEERGKREELYKKLAVLWEQDGKPDMAWECCRQGIEEYADSEEIWLLYIQLQLKDPAVDRAVCAATIQECIGKLPRITEQETYKKLQREYEIRTEGDKICVGK